MSEPRIERERESAVLPPAAPGRRGALVRGSMWGTGVLLVAALVLFVNYFGMKYHERFDWTGSKIYSLSEKSESVLAGLEKGVRVTVFLEPGSALYDPSKELLERYASASSRIDLRFVDPERNPVEAQRLVDRFKLSAMNVVVFEAGDEQRVVDTASLADWDYSGFQMGQPPTMTGYKGEEAFTGALLELIENRKPRVLFTTGHGERALEEVGGEGLSRIGDLLGRENLDLESWGTLGREEVPPGTDLVVVAGPRVGFLPPELEILDRFLEGGGRILLLLDPVLDPAGGLVPTGFEIWLADRGVALGVDLVVDPAAAVPFYGAETLYATAAGSHPIVESLGQADLPVLLALSRSAGPGEPLDGVAARSLLETTAEGWGETDLANLGAVARGEDDLAGPVPLAVAVAAVPDAPGELGAEDLESPGEEGDESGSDPGAEAAAAPSWRLVVVGDSDLATNGQLAAVGNPTFLANAFNWLLERENLLGIAAKTPEQIRLSLTPGQLSAITWGTLVGLPALAVLAGVAVWFRRRR